MVRKFYKFIALQANNPTRITVAITNEYTVRFLFELLICRKGSLLLFSSNEGDENK